VGHARGSSHGEARIIRHAYDHPDYVHLADEAFAAWRALERDSGENLLEIRPHLDLAPPDDPAFQAVQSAFEASGAPYTALSSLELNQRYPQLRLPENYAALLDGQAGLVRASRAVRVLVQQALENGATLLERCQVGRLEVSPQGVKLHTSVSNARTLEAETLVLAAGAWNGALLEGLGVHLPLQVYRTQSAFYAPLQAREGFPIFFDHPTQVYGIPEASGRLLKVGNRHRESVHPDRRGFEPMQDNLETLRTWVDQHLPQVLSTPSSVLTCLYTFTPDEDFIVDTLPGLKNVAVISACSGHGFKFAPVLGERVRGLLEGDLALPRFRLDRWVPASLEGVS